MSYVKSRPNVTAADIGILQQREIYEQVRQVSGPAPLVIDAGDFLRSPEAQLRALCAQLTIDFTPRMLHWPAGPRASDGVWAPHWYQQVYRSTGFEAQTEADIEVPHELRAILAEVMPSFEALYERRLRV